MIQTNIAELRAKAGLTQKQLAKKIDASEWQVQLWESGNAGYPVVRYAMRMSKLFGVTPSYILGKPEGDIAVDCYLRSNPHM